MVGKEEEEIGCTFVCELERQSISSFMLYWIRHMPSFQIHRKAGLIGIRQEGKKSKNGENRKPLCVEKLGHILLCTSEMLHLAYFSFHKENKFSTIWHFFT